MTSSSPASQTLPQKFDKLFKPWNRGDAPGFIAGLSRHRRLVYRKSFGLASVEHAVALTPATRI